MRKLNSSDAMLIAPEQAYFVRENLRLRLLDARTALMQRNGDVYQADLNDAEAAIKQYFDVNSPATQSWLKELGELKALDIRSISDDALKASITAVRNYQDSVRTGSIDVGSAAGQAQNAFPAPAATSAPAANASAPQAQKPLNRKSWLLPFLPPKHRLKANNRRLRLNRPNRPNPQRPPA